MKIMVTGSTGLVGAEVLRQGILNPDITHIVAVSRRQPPVNHPKIEWVRHDNFLDLSPLARHFRECQVLVWCLGISQSQVKLDKYIEITCEYTRAAAEMVMKSHPDMHFIFTSGQGADSKEKSRATFARYKGRAENILRNSSLKHLTIVRPGGIRPVHKNPDTAMFNKIMIPFFPVLEMFVPDMVISSVQLAQALLLISLHPPEEIIIENKRLREYATTYQVKAGI